VPICSASKNKKPGVAGETDCACKDNYTNNGLPNGSIRQTRGDASQCLLKRYDVTYYCSDKACDNTQDGIAGKPPKEAIKQHNEPFNLVHHNAVCSKNGWKMLGWVLSSNLSGDPVTSIPAGTNASVIVCPKMKDAFPNSCNAGRYDMMRIPSAAN
jgi:hypothetical protein